MRRLCLIGTALAVMGVSLTGLISGATGATAPTYTNFTGRPFVESWADTTHGWRFLGRRSNSGGWPAVQATENGGRSWHRILRAGKGFEIGLISRVSSSDGFAFVGSTIRSRTNRYLVTTDNGRHWKRLSPGATGLPIEASGRDLYWIRPGSDRRLFWAPNALAGHWRRTVVATLPPYLNFEALQAIPGGVAALVQTATDPGAPGPSGEFSTKLMVYPYGKLRTFVVAHSTKPIVCSADIIAFAVEWPVVTVGVRQATPGAEAELQCNFNVHNAIFVSRDGGATWFGS